MKLHSLLQLLHGNKALLVKVEMRTVTCFCYLHNWLVVSSARNILSVSYCRRIKCKNGWKKVSKWRQFLELRGSKRKVYFKQDRSHVFSFLVNSFSSQQFLTFISLAMVVSFGNKNERKYFLVNEFFLRLLLVFFSAGYEKSMVKAFVAMEPYVRDISHYFSFVIQPSNVLKYSWMMHDFLASSMLSGGDCMLRRSLGCVITRFYIYLCGHFVRLFFSLSSTLYIVLPFTKLKFTCGFHFMRLLVFFNRSFISKITFPFSRIDENTKTQLDFSCSFLLWRIFFKASEKNLRNNSIEPFVCLVSWGKSSEILHVVSIDVSRNTSFGRQNSKKC